MRRRDVMLGGALMLSIGANAYLLLRRTEPVAAPVAPAPSSHAVVCPSAPLFTAGPARKATGSGGGSASPCAELEDRLADTEAELEKHLPPDQRYERFARSEASEARIKPFLDKVFTDSGKGRGYQVECHGLECKLSIDKAVARDDWMHEIQSNPAGYGLIASQSFGPGVMITLEEKPPTPEILLVAAVTNALVPHNAEAEACRQAHKEPGDLTLTIALDKTARRLVLRVSGSLASSPLADCLRPLFEKAVAATPVPDEVTAFSDLPLEIQVPAPK